MQQGLIDSLMEAYRTGFCTKRLSYYLNNDIKVKVLVQFQSLNWIEGILNKIYCEQHKDTYRVSSIIELYDKVLNLASDLKEHFNLGLHIIQKQ